MRHLAAAPFAAHRVGVPFKTKLARTALASRPCRQPLNCCLLPKAVVVRHGVSRNMVLSIHCQSQAGGGGGKDFLQRVTKSLEDFFFNLTQRSQPRKTGGGGGLQAYQGSGSGAGGVPPGEQPKWASGGGQPDEPGGEDLLVTLRRFFMEWGEYACTWIVFLVVYYLCWPLADWCNQVQESPRLIVDTVQRQLLNLVNFIKWMVGWAEPDDATEVDVNGVEWVKGPMYMAVDIPLDTGVQGYEVQEPQVFDALRYPNMTEEDRFALTHYYALRPWERQDPFEIDKGWIDRIKAKYEPNIADRQLWAQLKAQGREAEYWANRQPKKLNNVSGKFETVSEGYGDVLDSPEDFSDLRAALAANQKQ